MTISEKNHAAPGSESLCRHQKTALALQVRFSVISALRQEVFLRSNVRQAGRHSFCGRRQYYRGQIGQYRFCAIENITHGDRHILRHLRMLFFGEAAERAELSHIRVKAERQAPAKRTCERRRSIPNTSQTRRSDSEYQIPIRTE